MSMAVGGGDHNAIADINVTPMVDIMNAVYERFFREIPPARSTVEVSRLPRQVAIEIDVVAAVG